MNEPTCLRATPALPMLPAIRPDLIAEPLGDELLIWDPRRRLVHHLDRVAALVFRACRDHAEVAAAEAALLPSAGSPAAARALLQATLALLAERHLLEPPEEIPALHPFAASSRRALLRGAGQAALMLPVLSSIFLPGDAAAGVSVVGGVPPVVGSAVPPNTERYGFREDQPFRLTRIQPHTTFGADVDTASYANVRRFLRSGQLPPADAVRIEELLNSFRYADREPAGDREPFAVTAELGPCPWQERHQLLRLGLQSRRVEVAGLPPRRLVFLLDTSGSMQDPDKLPLVRQAMRLLAETLRPIDQVAIVGYAGTAGVLLEPTAGDGLGAILSAIDRLEAAGSTAGAAGIELAYQLAAGMLEPGAAPRVLLATDGDFNVGVVDQGALVRLIEQQRRRGIYLSVLGFGRGNLNDATMELLADRGNGNYAYIDSLDEARRVLIAEGGATLHCVAKDLKLQVEWNPAEVAAWRLLGYENRMMAAEDFTDDRKDGGELGAGHHVTALFELVAPGIELPPGLREAASSPERYATLAQRSPERHAGELGQLRMRYAPPAGGETVALEQVLYRYAIEREENDVGSDFRLAAGLAAFGMSLRQSPERGGADLRLARTLVADSLGGDFGGQRAELLELVDAADRLAALGEEG